MTERRRVHLLVPDATRARLVVDRDGRPPVVALEFATGRTTFAALHDELASMGLRTHVVDLLIDQTEPPPSDDPPVHEVVCELSPPDELPGGWRWAPTAEVRPVVAAGLRDYVETRRAEWCDGQAVPPERSPWCEPGWLPRFEAWVSSAVTAAGAGEVESFVPHRAWGISAVYRVGTSAGVFWAKAVYDGFRHEPAITVFLDQHFPGSVPSPVAVEATEHWMLLRHLEGELVSSQFERTPDAVRALVGIQAASVPYLDRLLAVGGVDRGVERLATDLAEALGHPVTRSMVDLPDAEVAGLCDAVDDAVATVLGLGLPARTLVHGDFHGSNVMLLGNRVSIFDWSDAAVSHPLVDIGAWQSWFRDDPSTLDELWRTFAEAWSSVTDPDRIIAARRPLDLVAGAYHVVSFARIARGLEPLRRHEALSGLEGFLGQMRDAR